MMIRRLCELALALLLVLTHPANAAEPETQRVQTTWRLLDYVAVDYAEAVQASRVVNEAEYAEMTEFSATVDEHLRGMPQSSARPALIEQSRALRAAIADKADPVQVGQMARSLATGLIKAYRVPMAPERAPDLARGTTLYQEQCASCHGANGNGRGPAARGLDPAPIAFTDVGRANQRSVFALEQVINQGLEGTAMPSFSALPADDRWALAFHISRQSFTQSEIAAGQKIWSEDAALRSKIGNLEQLVALTPAALGQQLGNEQKARSVLAYLRSQPSILAAKPAGSLALTRQRLSASVWAYRSGDRSEARQLALSAYLDGFEPLEPALTARDPDLMRAIEAGMAELRQAIGEGRSPDKVEAQATSLDGLFGKAERVLEQDTGSDLSTFISALTILLREGLEALLIVVAMLAFLQKADRRDVLPFVHAGWIVALLAGVGTWVLATTLISISGAGRELTEGFGALFAAVVLVSVGIWMHGKSRADVWQRYIKEKLERALSRRSAWFLFFLSFVVVYREVFETILFFAAMWGPERVDAVIGGGITGAVILSLIAWAMLHYSHKLPITEFFRWSSWLIAALAVILVGKGIAALQEAGTVGTRRLDWVPTIDWLGVSPSYQALSAQLAVAIVLLIGFVSNSRRKIEAA